MADTDVWRAVFFFVCTAAAEAVYAAHVIDGTRRPNDRDEANGTVSGFGVLFEIINGGVGAAAQMARAVAGRIAYYKRFANYLKVPVPADEGVGRSQKDEAVR